MQFLIQTVKNHIRGEDECNIFLSNQSWNLVQEDLVVMGGMDQSIPLASRLL